MKKRVLSLLLAVATLVSMLPLSVFAAHDSTGRPLDLTGDVYLALYIGSNNFPGEPAEHDVSGYLNLNSEFKSPGFSLYAESAEGILKENILDDVVQGTSGVWGVFSTTGGSRYLDPANGIVNEDGSHNAETEAKIIQTAIDNNKFSLGAGESIDDYTIIWYVIKYQRSDSAWHIDGLITKKTTYSVNYYGNGNTSGAAPTGANDIQPGSNYTVLGNTGFLRKIVGNDTYIFNGWNTKTDGTGEHYDAGDVITVNENVTLYAEWYLQNKYTVTFVTKLDDVETNLIDFHEGGGSVTVWARLEDSQGALGEYFELQKGTAGTYTGQVTENGSYIIYHRESDGTMHPAHGHQVVIYNQNGRAECLHYSVTYDANAGSDSVAWSAGAAPEQVNYHASSTVIDSKNIPSRLGYTFLYWLDQDGNIIYPGDTITESISEKTVLTAQWQENIDVTVNVTIHHGTDTDIQTMYDVLLQLLRVENGVDLPLTESYLNKYHFSFLHDDATNTTTYSVTFTNMPQGIYKASATKSHYTYTMTHTGAADKDQTINVDLTYAPESFDMAFDVVVNFDNENEKELLPTAVNVRILAWCYDDDGVLGWHLISEHMGNSSPITVNINPETGKGSGSFTVYNYWPQGESYEYRVIPSSFVMPNGHIIPATGDLVTYKPDASGLYTAVVTIEPDETGKVPTYPSGSNTTLEGAYFDGAVQVGTPTVTVEINPYKVTFVAGEGTLNGQQTLVLTNQYLYPDLRNYTPVPNDANDYFTGWYDANGNLMSNQAGAYLTGDVTYYAKYSVPMTVEGTVTVEGTYLQDGEIVNIKKIDRATEIMMVLQKEINGNMVDVSSMLVPIGYDEADVLGSNGIGNYRFENIPNDGSVYRVKVLIHNYHSTYDNESDEGISYSETEYIAVLGGDDTAVVDVHLDLVPELYEQMMEVDASQISKDFRPTGALAEILYRDLGDIHHYDVIAQHTTAPFGAEIPLAANGLGSGSYKVWKNHTDGSLYEYQMNLSKLYGNVEGVFTADGTPYNSDTAPFVIEYAPASRYSAVVGGQARTLKATLIPKEYEILFDMGLDAGEEVLGMNEYLTDSKTGEDYYSYLHTWSYGDSIMVFPYRPGYVFEGWQSNHDGVVVSNGGYITVAAALAEDVVLTAKWRKLEGTAYTIRHLELNTDIPLHGAVVMEGEAVNTPIKAAENFLDIEGYEYVGAMIDGKLYSLNDEPVMTITNDPTKNVLTIYYLPDGSDGYTEQVESNLKLDKTAVLENNGTYTIFLETYTKDNPVTTLIKQNTPLDIVMVLDQSGSIVQSGYLDELQAAVNNFVTLIADHGRHNEVDHRIAIVGYAGNASDAPTSTDTTKYPLAGGTTSSWVNTGVFDSNGDFHPYTTVTGFNYTAYTGTVAADGTYYTYSDGEYLLLSYHEEYRHLITEEQARLAVLEGTKVYGYVYDESNIGYFTELTRNSSGLWLYGDKQLYSEKKFFTYHQDVWTHRRDLDERQIHAYGTGANYKPADGHDNLFTRTETTAEKPQLNVYYDALMPVSVGANGSGGTNPNLLYATTHLGSNGGTRVRYGIEMANKVFEANPLPENSDRVRIMVMFTDGLPGTGTFSEDEANEAIKQAYITKNTHKAYSYTIGLYPSNGVAATDDETIYMNAVSSNYPQAQNMNSVMQPAGYVVASDGAKLDDGDTYYVEDNDTYYEVKYGRVYIGSSWSRQYCWYYTKRRTNYMVSTATSPVVSNGAVNGMPIYVYRNAHYAPTDHSGYYSTTDSEQDLKDYFAHVMQEITTKITQEIILHEDTILRDIMGQGLVLTPGTVVTAYKVAGTYNTATGQIVWADTKEQVAQVTIPKNPAATLYSPETTSITYTLEDGTSVTKQNVPYISVYNLTSANATNPNGTNYHPHTVDITGYDFKNWYISEKHTSGYKMVVQITRVEARDDVEWGRASTTNMDKSGLWLPADKNGNRELLLPFDQPTTIFVERAYVLDYGKEFTLSNWYFDDDGEANATPIHLDCNVADGMNWFDPTTPNISNAIGGAYGNTKYGNVRIENGQVIYTPTTMNWGGYDQFYVFGNTWRRTVLAQDANQNGNLWNKVTVIPANNIYYEDSFVTTKDTSVNGIDGFTFSLNDTWTEVLGGANPGENTEIPEHLESAPYGDVHGWTDSLGDDLKFTDGSAHFTDTPGASAEFTFTGTGVDVYTRTNAKSGMVVAVLSQHKAQEDGTITIEQIKSIAMDNLAVSGDYYHIPTVSFDKLVYGTYTLQLIATMASTEDEGERYEYYLDGVRIYNPLGNTTNYVDGIVKDAYGLETNAVFTEVRDILLDYGDFNTGMDDDEILGAVFIDEIKEGQGTGDDQVATGTPSYEIGTFEAYGPKNEVYLSAGQAIVLKVDASNTYYVGLKSLNGKAVTVNVSGITQANPTKIQLSHTTDMYYRVTPIDGYIVIQNGNTDGAILSITNLRTTNQTKPAADGGILPVAKQEAVRTMRSFSMRMIQQEAENTQPDDSTSQQPQEDVWTQMLFASVRAWLKSE